MQTMAIDSLEDTFRKWSKPSSDTEQQKAENAVSMIRAAINESQSLSRRRILVFAQGSYRNNTNVKQDSDVDICALCLDTCGNDFSELPGMTLSSVGLEPATYHYWQFKDDVETALIAKFGYAGITRGSKAFDVHPTSYRVDADVVAAFEHRQYYLNGNGNLAYLSGTEFNPDTGGTIVNWPEQHYANGVIKNRYTGNRFKYITRVMKRLRYRMVKEGIEAARPIPSYFIECLVYNAPTRCFASEYYSWNMREVLAYLHDNTIYDDTCKHWLEVNERKNLFYWTQPWTRQQGFNFIEAAWNYLELE